MCFCLLSCKENTSVRVLYKMTDWIVSLWFYQGMLLRFLFSLPVSVPKLSNNMNKSTSCFLTIMNLYTFCLISFMQFNLKLLIKLTSIFKDAQASVSPDRMLLRKELRYYGESCSHFISWASRTVFELQAGNLRKSLSLSKSKPRKSSATANPWACHWTLQCLLITILWVHTERMCCQVPEKDIHGNNVPWNHLNKL